MSRKVYEADIKDRLSGTNLQVESTTMTGLVLVDRDEGLYLGLGNNWKGALELVSIFVLGMEYSKTKG